MGYDMNLGTNLGNSPTKEEVYKLIKEQFETMGYPNENPEDLKTLTKILMIWLDPNEDEATHAYTSVEWSLINDPECYDVLKKVQEYYVPKKRVTKTELTMMLEEIAQNKVTRRGYDFKQGCYVEEEPTFTERLQAIKLLKDTATVSDTMPAVQFINNIISSDNGVVHNNDPLNQQIYGTPVELVDDSSSPNSPSPNSPSPNTPNLNDPKVLAEKEELFEQNAQMIQNSFNIQTEAPKTPPEGHFSEQYMVDYFGDVPLDPNTTDLKEPDVKQFDFKKSDLQNKKSKRTSDRKSKIEKDDEP